jgi:hypothetical protein
LRELRAVRVGAGEATEIPAIAFANAGDEERARLRAAPVSPPAAPSATAGASSAARILPLGGLPLGRCLRAGSWCTLSPALLLRCLGSHDCHREGRHEKACETPHAGTHSVLLRVSESNVARVSHSRV